MLKTLSLLVLSSLPIGALKAQEPASPVPSPEELTAHHERLHPFVGVWKIEAEMAAMPGVPGMEKATKTSGLERAELVCNGTWLVARSDSEFGGQPASGLWMIGYDFHQKAYGGLAVSNMPDSTCMLTGRYDEKSSTWHFAGETSMGPFRSELVFDGADRSIETVYGNDPDGKEMQAMRIVRIRMEAEAGKEVVIGRPTVEAEASASDSEPAPAERMLREERGTWSADFKMEMQGLPPMNSKCVEVVEPICLGAWNWTTFTGDVMGQPFEGHALTGYDPKTKQIQSFWIDSMGPGVMRTSGTYDAESRKVSMTGTCYGPQGGLEPVQMGLEWAQPKEGEPDRRTMRTVFGKGGGHSVLTIGYRRRVSSGR